MKTINNFLKIFFILFSIFITYAQSKELSIGDPNAKVTQGTMAGDASDAKGKSKSKVDPAIFRMAEERDY